MLRLCPSIYANNEVILEIIVHDATMLFLCPCGYKRWAEETEVIGHNGVDVLECDIISRHAPTRPSAEAAKLKIVTLNV